MIVHAATAGAGSSDLTFTVPRASLAQAVAAIEQHRATIGCGEMLTDDAVAKVSIVGVGIRSNPELAATMFATLAERGINLLAVSASEIKVSVLVAEDEMELAVRVLHTAFGLDAPRGDSGMSGEGHDRGSPRRAWRRRHGPPEGIDGARHRVPRHRMGDPGRGDELDQRAPSRFGDFATPAGSG